MSEEQNVSGDHISEAAVPVDVSHLDHENAGVEEGQQVPLDALQAVRAKNQLLQDEVKMMKDHMSLLQVQRQIQSQPQPKDELDSLSDEDVLTVGEAKKFISKLDSQYKMNIQELRMTQKYPDYQQIVTKYLPDVLKQNPSLGETLQNSQDYELAYYLAKNSDSFKKNHKQVKQNADAERIVQNAQRAGSLSSVGQTSPMNEAKKYRDMSDAEFLKQTNKNLGYY